MTQDATDGLLRIILLVLAFIVLLPILMMALFMPFAWGMGGMWEGGMMVGTTGWGWGMLLVWFVVLFAIGYLVFRGISGATTSTTDPALEELRLQYARGELTDEEYEERLERLGGDE